MTKKNSTLKKDRIIKESIRSRYGKKKRGRRYSKWNLSGQLIEEVEKEGIKDD